jgi:soluble lytic murein transglycosylase-like protein
MKVYLLAVICVSIRTHSVATPEPTKQEVKADYLLDALMHVESRGDSTAYNEGEDAVGVLQIRPIMVREVNRLLGKDSFTLADRWSKAKSVSMFGVFRDKMKGSSDEKIARTWNGGYRVKKSTLKYWDKVNKHIIKQKSPHISIIHQ